MEGERKIPSTFLSPPTGDIKLQSDTWKVELDTETEPKRIVSIEIMTTEATTANLDNTTLDIVYDLDEVRELSVQAKTTLAKLQEFKNASKATKCQTAADCKSNQVIITLKH